MIFNAFNFYDHLMMSLVYHLGSFVNHIKKHIENWNVRTCKHEKKTRGPRPQRKII